MGTTKNVMIQYSLRKETEMSQVMDSIDLWEYSRERLRYPSDMANWEWLAFIRQDEME